MTVVDQSTTSSGSLTLRPYSPTIGVEVSGIDLREPLRPEHIDELRDALLTWKVLFFRDQDITSEQHIAFAAAFGELEVHPFAPHDDVHPELLRLTHDERAAGRENIWHSDVTWRLEPSLGSVLRMREAPEVGGDTLFADMGAAYDNLPDDLKAEIDGLYARHDFSGFRDGLRKKGLSDAEIAEYDERYPNPEHPVVRTHPETGRRVLYVNTAFTEEILGIDPARSAELLPILYRQATFPEFQCRFRWEDNSIAFWDNRSCQHYATSDYYPSHRRAERVTVIGDAPYWDPDQPVTGTHSSHDRFRGSVRRLAGQ